jgi:hypothetical protein
MQHSLSGPPSFSAYVRGCRCAACREYNRVHVADHRAQSCSPALRIQRLTEALDKEKAKLNSDQAMAHA